MTLSEIAQRIHAHLQNQELNFCDENTTGGTSCSRYLQAALGVESIALHEAVLSGGETSLTLTGQAALFQQEVPFTAVFSTGAEAETVSLTLSLTNRTDWDFPLETAGRWRICGAALEFQGILERDNTTGTLTGVLIMGDIRFAAAGTLTGAASWHLTFTADTQLSLRTILSSADTYLNLGLPKTLLPDVPLEKLVCTYDSRDRNRDHLYIAVVTAANLLLAQNFGLENLGFELHCRGSSCAVALTGALRLGGAALPTVLRFRQNSFYLGVDAGEDGCALPSLTDVAKLVGLGDTVDCFPAVLTEHGLRLTQLAADLPNTLDRLSRFSVGVSAASRWEFFGIHGLAMENILLGFSYFDGGRVEFSMIGTLEIYPLRVVLGGFYETNGGWTFQGALPEGEELELKTLIASFAQMLGISAAALPLPDISVYLAKVEFGLADSHFSGELGIAADLEAEKDILHTLLQIDAQVKIRSELQAGVRTFAGEFSGRLDIAENPFTVQYVFDSQQPDNQITACWEAGGSGGLTLTSLLEAFGVREIPAAVAELDLGISKVSLCYQLDKQELHMEVVSRHFETISLTVDDSGYEADLILRDKLTLSLLPVVGTSLHLLDTLAIEGLELLASSQDHPEKGTHSGAALLGSLCGQPFVLQIYQTPQEAVRSQENVLLSKYFPLNKHFGILELHRLGIEYQNGRIGLLLDASLAMSPIRIDLTGLGLGISLEDPSNAAFYLSGLGVDFDNGVLSIGGAFQKSALGGQESYDGCLRIQFQELSVYAMGTYRGDALLVYALLNAPLGGPPVCFVTGLAAGFGVNLRLSMPELSEIPDFPLVSGACGRLSPAALLPALKEKAELCKEQNFLAAGIQFTSFQMVQSFALVTVSFGQELELNLLGLSELHVPAQLPQGSRPLAFAQLALKASYAPAQGIFSLRAQLTSESYVLDKNCRLTGGFALCIWFGGEHKGDFLVTLGGYHPDYTKPAHYPDIPRLGFDCRLSSAVRLSGNAYFALTPDSIMAGGRLEAVFEVSPIKAWFIAQVDLFLSWKPFSYDIRLHVGIGVEVQVKLLFIRTTLRLEISADLHLWGPNLQGEACVKVYILSFTIAFGDRSGGQERTLDWSGFCDSFLPQAEASDGNSRCMPLSLSIASGLRSAADLKTGTCQTAAGEGLELMVRSNVPSTALSFNGGALQLPANTAALGVLPMGENNPLTSPLKVTLSGPSGPVDCTAQIVYENLPCAMWGLSRKDRGLVEHAAVALRLTPAAKRFPVFPPKGYIDLDRLSEYGKICREFSWNRIWQVRPEQDPDPIRVFSETVMSPETCAAREACRIAWSALGFPVPEAVCVTELAGGADSWFAEAPVLAALV